jgi:hypothetical protein
MTMPQLSGKRVIPHLRAGRPHLQICYRYARTRPDGNGSERSSKRARIGDASNASLVFSKDIHDTLKAILDLGPTCPTWFRTAATAVPADFERQPYAAPQNIKVCRPFPRHMGSAPACAALSERLVCIKLVRESCPCSAQVPTRRIQAQSRAHRSYKKDAGQSWR